MAHNDLVRNEALPSSVISCQEKKQQVLHDYFLTLLIIRVPFIMENKLNNRVL